tara:strand:- start:260 stop:361 length:102 start_codon:yes stop_codon:yes gene_type:complete
MLAEKSAGDEGIRKNDGQRNEKYTSGKKTLHIE